MSWQRLEIDDGRRRPLRGAGGAHRRPALAARQAVAGRRADRRGRGQPDPRRGAIRARADHPLPAGPARRPRGPTIERDARRCRSRPRSSASRSATAPPPRGSPPRPGSSCGACSAPLAPRPAWFRRSASASRSSLPADDGLDPVGRAQLELLARRGVAADALYDVLAAQGPDGLTGMPGIDRGPSAGPSTSGSAGTRISTASRPRAPASWDPSRMEYSFQVAAGLGGFENELRLEAAEYTGGRLDWYSFDVASTGFPMGASGGLEPHDLRVVPTPVRFAGQAASRWWQVENADVWFGDLNTAPEDLARFAVASYALTFGDDWFRVPCRLPAGVIVRADSVRVLDTFGQSPRHPLVRRAGRGRPDLALLRAHRRPLGRRPLDRHPPRTRPSRSARGSSCRRPSRAAPRAARSRGRAPPRRGREPRLGGRAADRERRRARDRPGRARSRCRRRPLRCRRTTRGGTPSRRRCPRTRSRSCPCTADGSLYLQRGRLAVSAEGEVETSGALGEILEPDRALLIHDGEIPATGAARDADLADGAHGGRRLRALGRAPQERRPAQPLAGPRLRRSRSPRLTAAAGPLPPFPSRRRPRRMVSRPMRAAPSPDSKEAR